MDDVVEVTPAAAPAGRRKPYSTKKRRQGAFHDALSASSFVDRSLLVDRCQLEIHDLCAFFRESLVPRLPPVDSKGPRPAGEAAIACAMEGCALPLPALAEEIARNGGGVAVQSLTTELPFIGSRVNYGIDDGGDELNCLWCWEARELVQFPKSLRGLVKFLRSVRKKVHSRIAALSVTVAAIKNSKNAEDYKAVLVKASERLGKESSLDDLRMTVERFYQKSSVDASPKGVEVLKGLVHIISEKAEEKVQEIKMDEAVCGKDLKQLKAEADLEARKHEKEQIELKKILKRQQDEALREERRREKEEMELKKRSKREQDEALREERKREKEEMELKKRSKREQDEAEREHKRREKEEAESRKQASLRKQATIMEKFLKLKRENTSVNQHADLLIDDAVPQPIQEKVSVFCTVTSSMDSMLYHNTGHSAEELWKFHLSAWHKPCHFNKFNRWGVRCKPKTDVVKEIRLQAPSHYAWSSKETSTSNKVQRCTNGKNDPCLDKDYGIEDIICVLDDPSDNDIVQQTNQNPKRIMKLLQFDKSPRPAYYGTWSKTSASVGPRHPLQKDPDLDYEVESDEEWEEEEPGESLTDCEKDEDDPDDVKGECKDDSEDGFVVPDGYLSENEGAEIDISTCEAMKDDATSFSGLEVENEEFNLKLQHAKYLDDLTEKALSKNKPLIISNLMHEKSNLLALEDLHGLAKIERMCLQALCMQLFPGGSAIEYAVDNLQDLEEDVCQSHCRTDASPASVNPSVSAANLPEIVKSIQSCSQSISKVVELLQQKFPFLSKAHIKSKVKEVAEFVDNHWKVKKEVLDSLGLPASPEPTKKTKGITTFFSKRCLPPPDGDVCAADLSPIQKRVRVMPASDADGPTRV